MTTSQMNRSILKQIFITFRTLFHRKRPRLVGVDKSGNRYFEAPPNEASEHTHLAKLPKRYFLLPGQNTLDYSNRDIDIDSLFLPPEWHSWLNHRRSDPPTEEEIEANALSKNNRLNLAAELEVKRKEEREEMIKKGLLLTDKIESSSSSTSSVQNNKSGFPIYPDLQISPDEDNFTNTKPK
ncbi:unnamed protein product [Schistosoma turkestanicum]|nr:unnamed protein product [Schistosoma turkestanicum]